jgi:hypothetical protein
MIRSHFAVSCKPGLCFFFSGETEISAFKKITRSFNEDVVLAFPDFQEILNLSFIPTPDLGIISGILVSNRQTKSNEFHIMALEANKNKS